MQTDLTTRVVRDPKYQELKSKRSRFGWWLALAMMVVYYGFILLVAFDKPFLASRLGQGVTTIVAGKGPQHSGGSLVGAVESKENHY